MRVVSSGSGGSAERRTFTPVFDDIAAEFGLTGAAIYGVIWRHSQMRHGYSHCSVATMSRLLQLSRRTVQRWLRRLEEEGWIRSVTPATGRRPAGYIIVRDDTTQPRSQVHSPERTAETDQGRHSVTPPGVGASQCRSRGVTVAPEDTNRIPSAGAGNPPSNSPLIGGVGGSPLCGPPPSHISSSPLRGGKSYEGAATLPEHDEATVATMFALRRQAKALQGNRRFAGDATQLREAACKYGAEAVEAALVSAQRLGIRSVTDALKLIGVEELDT